MAATKIDPACAVCGMTDAQTCGCEAHALEIAIRQAEELIMAEAYRDLRAWVRAKSREYVLEYFQSLTEPRKTAHSVHLDTITAQYAYHYNTAPAPALLARANDEYRRGVTEDWAKSVQKYPEVLQYYFSLVQINLPRDDATAVQNPPLGMLNELRARNRQREEDSVREAQAAAAAAAAAAMPHHHHQHRGQRQTRFHPHGTPMAFFRPPGF